MPGGRGTILDISNSLNDSCPREIAKAVKMAIDHGYRVSGTSITMLGAAYTLCDNLEELDDIWCHALEKGAVDWGEY